MVGTSVDIVSQFSQISLLTLLFVAGSRLVGIIRADSMPICRRSPLISLFNEETLDYSCQNGVYGGHSVEFCPLIEIIARLFADTIMPAICL